MKQFLECLVAVFAMLSLEARGTLSVSDLGRHGATEALAEPSEKKNDPAYKLYKRGYDLVLDEKWEEARKVFADVVKKYPKGEFTDDAEYWSAYALEHSSRDRDKSFRAFKDFLYKYPNSSYYDDAIAEMSRLKSGSHVTTTTVVGETNSPGSVEGTSVGESGVTIKESSGKGAYSYSYSVAPSMATLANKLRLAGRQLRRQLPGSYTVLPATKPVGVMPRMFSLDEAEIDPETRLKMQALAALGDTKEDSISFRTLRDVALDGTQARPVRETAMEALSNFTVHDPLPVFLEIAKKDTNEEMQNSAIDYIGELTNDKNRSVETLSELFHAIPSHRSDKREWVLGSIAEIGNDKAVGFLRSVALTNDDFELRSSAISYLGNIGSEPAREALYEILRKK